MTDLFAKITRCMMKASNLDMRIWEAPNGRTRELDGIKMSKDNCRNNKEKEKHKTIHI